MYNSIVILICVLAVYGAYSLLREVGVLISRSGIVYAAVRVENNELSDEISLAEFYTTKYNFFAGRPIIVSDDENIEELKKYGMDIYVKVSGRERYVDRE